MSGERERLEEALAMAHDFALGDESVPRPSDLRWALDRIDALSAQSSPGTTHADGCWAWGPKHYACAEAEIERLRAALEAAEARGEALQHSFASKFCTHCQELACVAIAQTCGLPDADCPLRNRLSVGQRRWRVAHPEQMVIPALASRNEGDA